MQTTPELAALGRRSSSRLVVIILVLIAAIVSAGLAVGGHQVGEIFSGLIGGGLEA